MAESTTCVRSSATTGMAMWARAQAPIHVPTDMTTPATATAIAVASTITSQIRPRPRFGRISSRGATWSSPGG